MEEAKKTLIEYLKKLSPGNPIRTVIDDLTRAKMGALIAVYAKDLDEIIEGGFKVNCKFTPQRLFELCKMDGAIILSSDLKRILYANSVLSPDSSIFSEETGTRHKAAERTARQSETLVIAVSERKNKTTLYLGKNKHVLRDSDEVLSEIISNLQILEKQREIFRELISKLNILEMSELVSVIDVCRVLQRAEIIARISEDIKKSFAEIGREGGTMNMRFKELTKGISKIQEGIIRDYSVISLKKTRNILSNLTLEGLFDIDSIARLILNKNLEEIICSRGFRFLENLSLNKKEASEIAIKVQNLNNLLKIDSKELEDTLKERAPKIKNEITKLREQIIEGKIID